jgi:hypothetical protein
MRLVTQPLILKCDMPWFLKKIVVSNCTCTATSRWTVSPRCCARGGRIPSRGCAASCTGCTAPAGASIPAGGGRGRSTCWRPSCAPGARGGGTVRPRLCTFVFILLGKFHFIFNTLSRVESTRLATLEPQTFQMVAFTFTQIFQIFAHATTCLPRVFKLVYVCAPYVEGRHLRVQRRHGGQVLCQEHDGAAGARDGLRALDVQVPPEPGQAVRLRRLMMRVARRHSLRERARLCMGGWGDFF